MSHPTVVSNDMSVSMMSRDELRQEVDRLRQLVDILVNIRHASALLVDNCRCSHHQSAKHMYQHFTTLYTHMTDKTSPELWSPTVTSMSTGSATTTTHTDTDITQTGTTDVDPNPTQDTIDNHNYDSNGLDENRENIAICGAVNGLTGPNGPQTTQIFTCYECDEDFETQSDLDIHTERIHLDGQDMAETYMCDKCYDVFDSEDQLHRHWRRRHGSKGLYRCHVCPYMTFEDKYLKRHETSHHSPRRTATASQSPQTSARMSPNKKAVKQTKSTESKTLIENNTLQLTSKKAKKSINDLSPPAKRGLSQVLSDESSPIRRSKRQTISTTTAATGRSPNGNTNLRQISEMTQNTDISNAYSLRKSVPTVSSAVSSAKSISTNTTHKVSGRNGVSPNPTNSPSLVVTKKDSNASGHYGCKKCRHLFPTELKLLNHLSYKHKVLSFECHLCDYKTGKKYYLERHMSIHTDAKPHQCDECHKWFKTRGILLTHKRHTHSLLKRYVCDVCPYRTANKSSLANHRSRHSTAKPYKCDVDGCDKGFKTSICLYQHKTVVHSTHRYDCTYADCDRQYHCKKALMQHLSIHEVVVPYACDQPDCQSVFKEKRSLKRHLLGVHKIQLNKTKLNKSSKS